MIALLLVCAYLLLPLEGFANLTAPSPDSPTDQTCLLEFDSLEQSVPHCPCSDRHESNGCDSGCSCCSCCAFVAPYPAGLAGRLIPAATSFSMLEPFKRFPEVYLPIFVPPQKRC